MRAQLALINPLDALITQYGQKFELICDRHKLFVVACLVDSLIHECSMAESWDEVDPTALLPLELTSSFGVCDWLSRDEKLSLIKTIGEQLATPANRLIT